MIKKTKAAFKFLEINKAVSFAILEKTWRLLAAPMTLFLIIHFFTKEEQGYYYTFYSMIALQSFFELGFCIVITQFASHEWSHLSLDEQGYVQGEPNALSRLVSLGRLVGKWYAVASVIFVFVVGAAGMVFFEMNQEAGVEIAWHGPWIAMVCLTALQLFIFPFLSLLEGCHQVSSIFKFRFCHAVASVVTLWLLMTLQVGLWVIPGSIGVGVITFTILLYVKYKNFFKMFFNKPQGEVIHWVNEIWPMQWRLAVSGLVNYFAFSLFNPVIFHYHGSVAAGKMGMTLQATFAIGNIALAWTQSRVPQYGTLIAKKAFNELDRFFYKISSVSMGVVMLGAVSFWFLVYMLNVYDVTYAQRILSPLPVAFLVIAVVFMNLSQCMSAYLRAYKREPIAVMSVVTSLLVGLSVWLFGWKYGPLGAAASYMAIVVFLVIPWESLIWVKCRRLWNVA